MKKLTFVAAMLLCAVSPLMAGGIFYNSNQSAEYFRTFARNAATDNADIVYYNMAGTVKMEDGLYVNASNQFFLQKATVETQNNLLLGEKTYTSDNPVFFCPNLYVLYKQSNWSIFTGLETIGATAIREWKDGLPTLDLLSLQSGGSGNSYLKGSSYYFAWRVGGAYQMNDLFSVAVAGRVVTSQQAVEGYIDTAYGKTEFDYTDKALGYSGEIGFDLFPMKNLVLSLTYEMATPLKFERNINDGKDMGGQFKDGEKKNLDLPQALRFGVSYNVTEAFRVEFNFDTYFEKYVNFNRLDDPVAGIDADDAYENTYAQGLAFEYKFNEMFLASIGFNLTQIGQKKSSTVDISIPGGHADYWSVGIGGQVTPIKDLKINMAVEYTGFQKTYSNSDFYDKQVYSLTGTMPSKKYNKEYINMAIGVEYKFM
ncbi:MAG TPA: hypothetical protein PKX79_01570 [Spirochaetota bacterium]|nr:hypothetical protein [Spirochaetota bacterium]